ncbi:MAG: Lrp/AsnC family transcriptional regulator [Desulfovibrionaceae bacterium]
MQQPQFTDTERRILALAGTSLSRGPQPFKDIAREAGCTEDEVLALLARLKEQHVIRRFGATLRHQKAGYGHNAMVAWIIGERDPDEVGKLMAAQPEISHCYRRRTYPEWEYDLYTMIHGKNPGDCAEVAARLSEATGLKQYAILNSIKELKKSSMRYF